MTRLLLLLLLGNVRNRVWTIEVMDVLTSETRKFTYFSPMYSRTLPASPPGWTCDVSIDQPRLRPEGSDQGLTLACEEKGSDTHATITVEVHALTVDLDGPVAIPVQSVVGVGITKIGGALFRIHSEN